MNNQLKEIHIKNFKSLKDVDVVFNNFNVIVGRNGSGKTNFVEVFKFLKNVLVEEKRPYMPYSDWWSYENIVWKRKAELPIRIGLRIDVLGHDICYEFAFSGLGGTSRLLEEKLILDGVTSIEREGSLLKISHDRGFVKTNEDRIKKMLKKMRDETTIEYVLEHTTSLPKNFSSLLNLFSQSYGFRGGSERGLSITVMSPTSKEGRPIVILFPQKRLPATAKDQELKEMTDSGFPFALLLFLELKKAIEHFTILRHPNIREMKSPTMPKKEEVLSEDSLNLHNILYFWFLEKGMRIPERIEKALSSLFPNIRIQPSLTSEGKVFLKMFEREVELSPPCIPDGLYKILAILSAIELKPSLLAIDEIENSLHAEALEYILDELRNSGVVVIVTTHSPIVVDMVKLEELFISEMTPEGTVLGKVKNPKEVREKLRKLKLTQSESWIYGALPVD